VRSREREREGGGRDKTRVEEMSRVRWSNREREGGRTSNRKKEG
jgi:hypothetical protein